jgi:CheY-like chemotaxis protein
MTRSDTAGCALELGGLSVLVVEDETIVSLLVESMLEDLGCGDVWYASGVQEALEILARRTPDAAVLDVNLAGEPAFPVARQLASAAVPFVFATGYGATGIHEEWTGRPVIQKPFRCDMLACALAAALGGGKAADVSR